MKSQKGMSLKMLIICIFILVVLAITIAYFINSQIRNEKMQTYKTNMLLIQGKIKVLSQESTIQKKDEILKGEKLLDKLEEEKIKELLDKKVINQEEENFSKCYIWNQETLNEVGLSNIYLQDGCYIVNYETDEVIYSEGINIGNKVYYRLSELLEIEYEKEILEENIIEQVQEEKE